MIAVSELVIDSTGRGYVDLTARVNASVGSSGIQSGICSVFLRHTSASLILCENADPDVLSDLETFMSRLVTDGEPLFAHNAEGDDDMPAHIRSILTHTEVTLPIRYARLDLGTWQGLYLWEHRTRPHRRTLALSMIGEA